MKFLFRFSVGLYFTIALLLMGFWQCKRGLKELEWESDYTLPIAQGKLSLLNLVSDTLIGNEAGNLFLKINQPLITLNGKEIAKIKDTVLTRNFSFPIDINLEPGFIYYNQTEKTPINLGGIELTEAILSEGKLRFEVKSTLKERSKVEFTMPCVKNNGAPLIFTDWIAKSNGTVVTYVKEVNLAGYTINLKGLNGQTVNEIYYTVKAQTDPNGQPVIFATTDQFVVNTAFVGLKPYYVKGYLGKQNITSGVQTVEIPFFKKFKSGQLLLSQASASLTFKNYIGADFKLKINKLKSINNRTNTQVTLQNNNLINQYILFNRAQRLNQGTDIPVKPFAKEFVLDNTNSNLKEFIQILPDKIEYDFNLEVNPLGNVSGGDDFIYFDKVFNANLNLTVPLNFNSNALLFVDTLHIAVNKLKNSYRIKEASIGLNLENTFPASVGVTLYSVDANDVISATPIAPQKLIMEGNSNNPASIDWSIKLSETDLRNVLLNGKLLLQAVLNSPNQNTVLTSEQYLKFKNKLRVVYLNTSKP
jgi:hypothetical protein